MSDKIITTGLLQTTPPDKFIKIGLKDGHVVVIDWSDIMHDRPLDIVGNLKDAIQMIKPVTRPNDAKWIRVEDELPKEEGYYLVAFNYGTGQMPFAVNPTRCWNGTNFVTMATVKHWMPLPTPPKQSSEGEE